MPRKSAASLSVVPLLVHAPTPLPPPPELTPIQRQHWDDITQSRPPDYFDRASQALLVQYVRHAEMSGIVARLLQETDPASLPRLSRLGNMQARESAALSMLSMKLRLAPAHVRRLEQKIPARGSARLGKQWQSIE